MGAPYGVDIYPQNPILVVKALFVKTSGPVSRAGGKSLSAFELARGLKAVELYMCES